MMKHVVCGLLMSISIVNISLCYADTETENQALARLIHEMDALNQIIKEAKTQQDPKARSKFQYHWLHYDLQKIRTGITAHIHHSWRQPRNIKPIQGDYDQ